ncbi:MAG: DUF192 domain-containing protein [Desulfomonile tiedjei]|uniref:DUF192 domain-containing protein n=1 Tax=Desulfomonile tiedjei TaxID=2358 RepID=A0A9D6V4J9_9BACT|nr:DUF192 domain-containing protein [Desulfomonile tiedjei]
MYSWHNLERRTSIILRAVLVGIVFSLCWSLPLSALENPGGKMQTVSVTLGAKTIRATLANTPQSRIQGLLGWTSIDEDSGMLLDFIADTNSAVHMQGMKFPIDAIWVDSKDEIKVIYREIQPDKGLVYPSMVPCRYCLEVKAGFCKKYGVQIGQKVRFAE